MSTDVQPSDGAQRSGKGGWAERFRSHVLGGPYSGLPNQSFVYFSI
jgi:hypothetical protein